MSEHWPEYLIEACGLGLFMFAASLFGAALEFPASPVHEMIPDPAARRAAMGIAMGLTAMAIIYSPWGMRSGAHINPAVTMAFWRLGRVGGWDALFYVVAQAAGGAAGVMTAALMLGRSLAHPAVDYVVTVPGASYGRGAAFAAELGISFGLMFVVLLASNTRRLARFTGLLAACLVALYIFLEAPVSGMSMNPARSFASALTANVWTGFWIYLTAPPLAMLAAAEAYVRLHGARSVHCAKLHHENRQRRIFHCDYPMAVRGHGATARRDT